MTTTRELPGPRGLPLVGSMLEFMRHGVFDTFDRLFRDHGDLARMRLPGGQSVVAAAHPAAVEQVLRANRDNYYKGVSYDPLRLFAGENLVTAEGAAWAWRRRLAQPAFSRESVAGFLPAMDRCAQEMLGRWARDYADGRTFDLQSEMVRLTMRIVGATLFGVEIGPRAEATSAAFDVALAEIHDRGASLSLPLAVPTPGNLRLRRAIATLRGEVEAILADARAHRGERPPSLLDALLDARDPETGQALTAEQLRDEVIVLHLAGHETTATLLTWTFWALAGRPEVTERLTEEAGALGDATPAIEALQRLAYARAVIHEVLRLYPPAWMVPRTIRAEDEILGFRIPAGGHLMLSTYHLHRHPEFWEAATELRPERFLGEASERHKYAYLPFSLGPRTCIGNTFSLYESSLVLARIVRRFAVEVEPGFSPTLAASTVLRPANGLRVRLRPRA